MSFVDPPLPGIIVEPNGQTVSVTITSKVTGATPTVYSDPFAVNTVSMPKTISARTTFYTSSEGPWTVNGQTVILEDNQVATVNIPLPVLSAAATVNEYWVSNGATASDSNTGDRYSPFATLVHAASVAGSQSVIHCGYGTFALGTTGVSLTHNGAAIEGVGKYLTTITYTGTGSAVDLGNGTLTRAPLLANLTVDITAAGSGATGLAVDNSYRGIIRDVWVNATSNANATNCISVIGSNTKSTYYNEFVNVDATSSTGGACVKIGDACNGNVFFGGVYDGSGYSILAQPVTTNTDTCKWFGTAFSTDTSASDSGVGAKFITLGGGGAIVADFDFVACRGEPGGSGPQFLFTHGGGTAQNNSIRDGTYSNAVQFVSNAGDLNGVFLPKQGVYGPTSTTAALLPSGVIAESIPGRLGRLDSSSIMSSGTALLQAIYLPPCTVSTIKFMSGSVALSRGTNGDSHVWLALCDSTKKILAVSADDTSGTWLANTFYSANMTTPVYTPGGLYYIALLVNAGTGGSPTMPSLIVATLGNTTLAAQGPIACLNADSGLTTPQSVGFSFTPSATQSATSYAIVQ